MVPSPLAINGKLISWLGLEIEVRLPLLIISLASPIFLKLIFVIAGAVDWKIEFCGWRYHF